jgi:hypothetical protein
MKEFRVLEKKQALDPEENNRRTIHRESDGLGKLLDSGENNGRTINIESNGGQSLQ